MTSETVPQDTLEDEFLWKAPPGEAVDIMDGEKTIARLVSNCRKRYGPIGLLGTRSFLPDNERGDFEFYNAADMAQAISELAYSLTHELGMVKGDRIALMSQNRVEWAIGAYTAAVLGLVAVPVYDTMEIHDVEHVLSHSGSSTLLISIECLPKLNRIENHSERLPELKNIVVMDDRLDDRAWCTQYVPELVPIFVSTNPASKQVNESNFEAYKDAFETYEATDEDQLADGLRVDAFETDRETEREEWESSQMKSENRTPSTDEVDATTWLFPYQPPSHVSHRFFPANGDDEESIQTDENSNLASLITHTYSQLRSIAFSMIGPNAPLPDVTGILGQDNAALIYTSGTTGEPKGAILTNENIVWAVAIVNARLRETEEEFRWPSIPDEAIISYLPCAHVFGFGLLVRSLSIGEAQGFYQGDPMVLLDDIQRLQPTFFAGVPRVYGRVFDKVMAKVESGSVIKRLLVHRAIKTKKHHFFKRQEEYHGVYDRLVFKKMRKTLFGKRIRRLASGSAPLPAKIGEFLQLVCDGGLLEGYGATETCCMGCLMRKADTFRLGTVGSTSAEHEIKLRAVLEYSPQEDLKAGRNPRGEILVRGPSVFAGYYKAPEATASVLEDGWYSTGDVGEIYNADNPEDSYIKIIDRVKNVFKLSQGVFVASEAVSATISQAPIVDQFYLYANSERSYVTGVVVPNPSELGRRAHKVLHGFSTHDDLTEEVLAELCNDPKVIADVHKHLEAHARKNGVQGFCIPKAIVLEPTGWTSENGYLTPSMKPRLPRLKQRYGTAMERAYEALESADRAFAAANNGNSLFGSGGHHPRYQEIADCVLEAVGELEKLE